MALFLNNISLELSAFELTIIFQELNNFHRLDKADTGYGNRTTGIVTRLNQILNPHKFEATTTSDGRLLMVMMD